ncbi:Uu.00g117260.m01.CDS01 [Anthostomella pinea]|uniref:Uu.00g117260.m01.CDS01 n=1 Tax=Anthostomella pinea TaxID=933095 RepID=A0AAI8VG83_9PEZI|nr:Uu.00g117260.m01.CDS01 [Anthostomella pinea]
MSASFRLAAATFLASLAGFALTTQATPANPTANLLLPEIITFPNNNTGNIDVDTVQVGTYGTPGCNDVVTADWVRLDWAYCLTPRNPAYSVAWLYEGTLRCNVRSWAEAGCRGASTVIPENTCLDVPSLGFKYYKSLRSTSSFIPTPTNLPSQPTHRRPCPVPTAFPRHEDVPSHHAPSPSLALATLASPSSAAPTTNLTVSQQQPKAANSSTLAPFMVKGKIEDKYFSASCHTATLVSAHPVWYLKADCETQHNHEHMIIGNWNGYLFCVKEELKGDESCG